MSVKHETIMRPTMFYAFVDLEPEHPVGYVVHSSVISLCVRDAHRAWLALPGKKGRPHKDNDMRRILPAYSYEVGPRFKPGWMDEFKERWDLLHKVIFTVQGTGT